MARSADTASAYWPQFRGPDGQGHTDAAAVPTKWSESTNVRWKTELPGRGWSSPVLLGEHIWLTTAIESQANPDDLQAEKDNAPNTQPINLSGELSLRAICVSLSTGKIVHNIELFQVDKPKAIHTLNSYASPTPIVEPGRLYCHFGRYGTACIDTSVPSVSWTRKFEVEHFVGPGSSPVVCDDLLVLTCDGADIQYVVAVNKVTGQTAWKVDRPPIRATNPDFRKSYCTPLVVEHAGSKQIVIPGAQWLISYRPRDGSEVWRFDHGHGFSLVPRPIVDDSHVYCCTGFTGKGLLAIELGGTGDITETHASWVHKTQIPTQPSPVLANNRIFTVSDNGIGQCLDAKTGDVVWKKRIGGTYSASPLSIGPYIYFFNREGMTTLLDHEGNVVTSNQLDGALMATPAVLDGEMVIRTDTHLYAISE